MSRIISFVCASEVWGLEEAGAKEGWTRIAAFRFAGPDKDDIRVVRRYSDLPPGTPLYMMRAADFDKNPEKERFEKFVADGHGKWLDE